MWILENFKEKKLQEFIQHLNLTRQTDIDFAIAQCRSFIEEHEYYAPRRDVVIQVGLLAIGAIAAQSLYSYLHPYLPAELKQEPIESTAHTTFLGATAFVISEGLQTFYSYAANLQDYTRELSILLCYLYLERNNRIDVNLAEELYTQNLKATVGEHKDTDGALLWLAAKFSDWKTVEQLLKLPDIDINVTPQMGDDAGFTVLKLAAKSREWHIVTQLIQQGAAFDRSLFITTIESGTPEAINAMLQKGFDPEVNDDFGTPLIITAAQNRNWSIVKILIEHGIDLNATMKDGVRIKDKLLDLAANENVTEVAKYMDLSLAERYKLQFGYQRGNITYDGCLAACAAIADTKADPSSFDPVVLNRGNEFAEFLTTIKDNQHLLVGKQYKFILAGDHWLSGTIEIQADKINILFIDPTGAEKFYRGSLFDYGEHPLDIANAVFSANADSIEITVAKTARQSALNGCSIYAIDDVRKLYKFATMSEELNNSMLRSIESLKRIKRYVESKPKDIDQPINKKGETFMQSVQRNTGLDIDGNPINARIDRKLAMLNKKVAAFVNKYSASEVEQAKQRFTLGNFAAEIAKLKRPTQKIS